MNIPVYYPQEFSILKIAQLLIGLTYWFSQSEVLLFSKSRI